MLEACRHGESNITAIVATVLKPGQLNELRSAIVDWQQEHSDLRRVLITRGLGLAAEMAAKRPEGESSPGSVFGLILLDPLSGLDPAARELAQTRVFAERALFLGHRMPTLLRWQTELLALETAEMPWLRELRTSTIEAAGALNRAAGAVQELPSLVRSERQEILKALTLHESSLTNLAAHTTTTIQAGQVMMESVNTTLKMFRELQQETQKQKTGRAAETFRIQEYTEAAKQVDLAAQKLTELLRSLDQTLGSTNIASLNAGPTVVKSNAGRRNRSRGLRVS
jgi:hypothetical protein